MPIGTHQTPRVRVSSWLSDFTILPRDQPGDVIRAG